MSVTTSNFQQLNLLRKILLKKNTGTLSYTAVSGKSGDIEITMGHIIDNGHSLQQLTDLLSLPLSQCDWLTTSSHKETDHWIEPTLAISRAVNNIQWDRDITMNLKQLFIKLPPVQVRMIPLYRYEYNDGLSYLMLYQQSVKEEKFLLANFLDKVSDEETLKRRIKVLVLGYCLGLVIATPQTTGTNHSSHASIASRISRRIRGI